MLRMKIAHRLRQPLSEVDSWPASDIMLWQQYFVILNEERKYASKGSLRSRR